MQSYVRDSKMRTTVMILVGINLNIYTLFQYSCTSINLHETCKAFHTQNPYFLMLNECI